jgi:hypothetical protein
LHAERLHGHKSELQAKLRRFGAVKLQQIQLAALDGRNHVGWVRVRENSHPHDRRRQAPGNLLRRFQRDITWAAGEKHQSQRVGSRPHGGLGVGGAGNPANLNFDIHW